MTIQIGDDTLKIKTPADLDARLIAITGCNAAEIGRIIRGFTIASSLAAALLPFLADPISIPELADKIEAAGVDEVKPAILALYAPVAPSQEAPADDKG